MSYSDFLMQGSQEQTNIHHLQEEVVKLQAELDTEQALSKVLQSALQGPVLSDPCLSSLIPPQVRKLLSELAVVEEEILWLEKKGEEIKMRLYEERKQLEEWQIEQSRKERRRLRHQNRIPRGPPSQSLLIDDTEHRSKSQNYEIKKEKVRSHRRASFGSAAELLSMPSFEEIDKRSRRNTSKIKNQCQIIKENDTDNPNYISEELIKCLISIILELNQASQDREGSVTAPKLGLPGINSNAFPEKTSFNYKGAIIPTNQNTSTLDPYGIFTDFDCPIRDIGPYKNFINITRSKLDITRFTACKTATGKLRILMQQLCEVDLTYLAYKEKLAFWINIYNACILNAFLEHGLPSTQDKLLAVMNKAALNVGGTVLNALAIEHFILRHPCESKYGPMDEKEMLLQHAYGLGYPEPNMTFALCRGSWSSPALRVYTPEEVVNELGRARVEYLEASVGVTSKKKIVVPKLLQWHMKDFADDMESLLEWICSHLPRSGSLKGMIMECLNGQTRYPITKMVEIQPYEADFRYLLPL